MQPMKDARLKPQLENEGAKLAQATEYIARRPQLAGAHAHVRAGNRGSSRGDHRSKDGDHGSENGNLRSQKGDHECEECDLGSQEVNSIRRCERPRLTCDRK